MWRSISRIVMTAAALSSGVALRADEMATLPAASEVCAAEPAPRRIQVLVELVDTPALRAYEASLAASSVKDPREKEAQARASERAQDQKIKEAQESLARELAGLGARELYRVRRSFNGISVVLAADKLAALRALSGVKAIHPRSLEAPSGRAEAASGPSSPTPPADSGPSASGLRAYLDPATGQLTSAPTDAQVRELDRRLRGLANRSSDGLEVVTRPDGIQIVDLHGRFRSFSTATVTNGVVSLHCNDGETSGGMPSPSPAGPEKE